MSRWRDALFLGGGIVVGLLGAARVSAAPPIVVQAPQQQPLPLPPIPREVPPSTPGAPTGAAAGCADALVVTRLSDNTLVSVKDHGDSQTVLVYTFDDNGVMKPAPQKLRFFYRF